MRSPNRFLRPSCLYDKHTINRILVEDLNFDSQHVHVDISKAFLSKDNEFQLIKNHL